MMKKLLVILPILIILAGVVFYFGWVQIQLPENTFAVIFTKTGGWDDSVTKPGTFVWRWERLLPTNLSIHKFKLAPYTTSVSAMGSLPSGDVYAQVLDPPPEFSFSLKLSISFTLNPEALPGLVSDALLSEESYSTWHSENQEIITAKASAFIRERSTKSGFAQQLTNMGAEVSDALSEYLESSLPYLNISACTIRGIEVPDFDLYIAAKELYLDLARKRKESLEAALEQISWTESRTQAHFDALQRYGELITQYPSLLDLIELKEGNLGSILEDIDSFSVQEQSFPVD